MDVILKCVFVHEMSLENYSNDSNNNNKIISKEGAIRKNDSQQAIQTSHIMSSTLLTF